MKKYLILFIFITILSSCSNTSVQVSDPTTVSVGIAEKAIKDTTTYKVVAISKDNDQKLYVFDTKTNTLIYKARNDDGAFNTALLIIMVMLFSIILMIKIISD